MRHCSIEMVLSPSCCYVFPTVFVLVDTKIIGLSNKLSLICTVVQPLYEGLTKTQPPIAYTLSVCTTLLP